MPIGELAAVLAAITWAVGSIFFARIGRTVPPGAMNLGKLFAAGLALTVTRLVVAPVAPLATVPARAHGLLVLSAIAGLTIGDTAYFAAMEAIGVSRAVLLLSAAPVFTAIGGYAFLGEQPNARSLLGIAVILVGIVLVVLRPADPSLPRRPHAARGLVFGAISALGQASGSLLSRRAMQQGIDPLAAGAGRVVVGGLVLLAVAVLTRKARPWLESLARDRAWLSVASAAMIGSYGGIWLAQTGIARASSAGAAATLLATTPVFVVPIAHYSGVERATARAIAGAVVTVIGIATLTA
ncbi:MAG: DMT family transporter [Deltaproteobacteria bacterium]